MTNGEPTGADKPRRFAEFSAEALKAGGPRRAAALTASLAMGRLRFGFGMDEFLLFDLANRPSTDWADYVREESHNAAMLRILHPPPARIARDKVLSLERTKPVSDSYGRGVMAFTRREGGWHDGSALQSPQQLAEILLL